VAHVRSSNLKLLLLCRKEFELDDNRFTPRSGTHWCHNFLTPTNPMPHEPLQRTCSMAKSSQMHTPESSRVQIFYPPISSRRHCRPRPEAGELWLSILILVLSQGAISMSRSGFATDHPGPILAPVSAESGLIGRCLHMSRGRQSRSVLYTRYSGPSLR